MTRSVRAAPDGQLAERRAPPSEDRGTRFAAFAPNTYDATARSVEAVLSAGSQVKRYGFIEELEISDTAVDLGRAQRGLVPLLNAHDQWAIGSVLGTVSGVRVAAGSLVGSLTFAETDAGREAEGMVSRGELRGVSIGYRVTKWEISNVDEMDNETWRATAWELLEVSLVPVPADPNAGVRSATDPAPGTNGNRAANEEEDDMTRSMSGGAAAPAPSATPAPTPAPTAAPVGEESRAAEPARPAEPSILARFTATSALALVEQARAFGDTVVTRAQELIAQNERGEISPESARSALLASAADAQRAATTNIATGGRAIEMGQDARDKFLRGATNAILLRAGLADMVRNAATLRGEKIDLDPGEFRGIRNVELARMSLERAGQRVDSYDRDVIVGQALAMRAGPMQSTSDFPLLLENVMHKTLQAAYLTTPDTWRRFTGVGSVTDFRPHPRYLRGTFGALDDVLEDGEFKNKPIPDAAKESISAKTKGNIVALTRQAIVNDDMSAFSSITVDLARAAKLSVEKDVYALLALNAGLGPVMNDGNTLFHASHNNIAAVAAAPGVTSIDLMRQLMASQTDVSGNEILDIKPAIWLGPLTLGGAVRVTVNSEYDPDTASKLQRFNMVRNIYSDIVDTARLSGARWYNFADPSVAPAIEVVFLNGNQEPYTEMREGWRVDGTEFKVRHDYGVGAVNWRSAATNAGV